MPEERKRGKWWAVAAALLVLLFAYGGCYIFVCDEVHDSHMSMMDMSKMFKSWDVRMRTYRSRPVAIVFAPAAWVEAQCIRIPVGLWYPTGSDSGQAAYWAHPLWRKPVEQQQW